MDFHIMLLDKKVKKIKLIKHSDVSIEQAKSIWLEGNYSCDCNRSIFFHKLNYNNSYGCSGKNNEIELLGIIHDGMWVYTIDNLDEYIGEFFGFNRHD